MSLRSWLERIFLAVTFAEANDHKTARDILKDAKKQRKKAEKKLLKRRRLRPPNFR